MSKIITITVVILIVTYTLETLITLCPGSRAIYNAMRKLWYLKRSGLAFIYTLISITVGKSNCKFRSGVEKRYEMSIQSSTQQRQQHCTTHCPVSKWSSSDHWPAFCFWSTGVLWYNTEPTALRLSTMSQIVWKNWMQRRMFLPLIGRQKPLTASAMDVWRTDWCNSMLDIPWRMETGPNRETPFPVPKRYTEMQRMQSAYWKSKMQQYTNVPALTLS
jgi:hypothetical protein